MRIYIYSFLLLFFSVSPSPIFSQNFERFNLQGSTSIEVASDGTWYQPNEYQSLLLQIKYDNQYYTQVLDTINISPPSYMCNKIQGLQPNAFYDLSLDVILPSLISTVDVQFEIYSNQEYIGSIEPQSVDISQKYEFQVETFEQKIAQICFYINVPSYIATGPSIDNITLSFQSLKPQNRQDQNQKEIENQEINENQKFIIFSSSINQIISWIGILGFGYIISNLLNFWNLIILYYFLFLEKQPDFFRNCLQNICIATMSQGSLVKFVSKILGTDVEIQIPEYTTQRIFSNNQSWKYYSDAQISSNFIKNGYQVYLVLCYTLFKIIAICMFKKIPIECLKQLQQKIRYKALTLFFIYDIIANSHILVLPYAILWFGEQSQAYSMDMFDRINNGANLTIVYVCIMTILLYQFIQLQQVFRKNKKSNQQQYLRQNKNEKKVQLQQSIVQQKKGQNNQKSNKNQNRKYDSSFSLESINLFRKGKINEKPNKTVFMQNKLQESFITKNIQQQRLRKIAYGKRKILFSLLDNSLFVIIPFLLQSTPYIFFASMIGYFSVDLLLIYKYHKCLVLRQKIFRFIIKIVWSAINIVYLQFWLTQQGYIDYSEYSLNILGQLSIILIILGALIQILHSLINLIVMIKKILEGFCQTKILNNRVQIAHNKQQIQIIPNTLKNIQQNPHKILKGIISDMPKKHPNIFEDLSEL